MISVVLACLWVLLAQVITLVPSNDKHWKAAYFLMAAGFPILCFLWIQHGVWVALLGLIAGASVLRWPVYYGYLWVRRLILREAQD